MEFVIEEKLNSIIKVIGVGGGGCNAVNHMHERGIVGVDFIICNTDMQCLDDSKILHKIQLGENGLGAGAKPENGAAATRENLSDILNCLSENTKMVFVTAGMGGGTGTGGAPIVAEECRKRGLLTVGICTTPFEWEGPLRTKAAQDGIEQLKEHVDTLIIISNDKLEEMYSDMDIDEAFVKADDVLSTAAKGIAEIITVGGKVNVDFEDVRTVMENSGVAIMGTGFGSGEGRAIQAVKEALDSPLLNDNNIFGAKKVLLNITYGSTGFKMNEFKEISHYIKQETGGNAEIIWGKVKDEEMDDTIKIVLIATGFEGNQQSALIDQAPTTVSLDSGHTIDSVLPKSNGQTFNNSSFKKNVEPEKPITKVTLDQSNYDEVMRMHQESNSFNRNNNNINNKIEDVSFDTPSSSFNNNISNTGNNVQNTNYNQQEEFENREVKLQDLSFRTHSDKSSDLLKKRVEALKKRSAFSAKGMYLPNNGNSSQHNNSETTVQNNGGETRFQRNKFLHKPKVD